MLIPIAKIKDDVIHIKKVHEFNRVNYYYINFYGEPTIRFRSIEQAKAHIQDSFGDLEGFELL